MRLTTSVLVIILLPAVILAVCLANPADLASVLPLSLLLNAILTDVSSDAVLFARFPFSDILAAISPYECAMSLTLIIYELAAVALAVLPFEFTFTIHFILSPVARV